MPKKVYIAGVILLGILISVILYRRETGFTRMKSGLRYKVISIGEGPFVQPGEWLKMRVKQVCGDSVLVDPIASPPQYVLLDSPGLSPESLEIFSQVSAGDSLVFFVNGDTSLSRKRPGVAKQCNTLKTFIRVEKILFSIDSVRADMKTERYQVMPDSLKNIHAGDSTGPDDLKQIPY